MHVRLASSDDIPGIARVHVESWRSTYKGIISDAFLSSLTVEKRIRNWEWTFNNLHPDEVVWLLKMIRGSSV